MRVERIALKNIGPFEDAVLEMPPAPSTGGEVILFEGPNGTGKTTIAQVLAAVAWSRARSLSDIEREVRRRGRSADFRAEIRFVAGDQWTDAVVDDRSISWTSDAPGAQASCVPSILLDQFGSAARGPSAPVRWAAFAFGPHLPTLDLASEGPRRIDEGPLSGALSFGRQTPAARHLGQLLVNLEFDMIKAERYARTAATPEEREKLETTARNRQNEMASITGALSKVLGRSVKIELPVGSVDRQSPTLRLDDDPPIPMDLLGEGFRSTSAWLSDLMVRLLRVEWQDPSIPPFEQEFWLILDEVEESLHPQMQIRLLPSLREIFPNARIYATTHSPFVVASLGEGYVFRLRPDARTHRVSGTIQPLALTPGRSLEWVVEEVFDAPAQIVDEATREKLEVHRRGVDALRRSAAVDWSDFLATREWLRGLNDEIRAIVSMREVPVRARIEEKLQEKAA
ncbi:MAG: AAA family ATPase [Polyangiaceae bacterium]